ncbi:MAG: DUF4870 domain-containing protein [Leptospirales bacterium]|nr:DUF4870 domain-containing protein [Leptospirales bacterium]
MADKIREIQSRFTKNLKDPGGSDSLPAVIGYVPLFGWIYPTFFKKDNDFCQFHGKQAMQLNGLMVAVYFIVWILEHFPITSWLFGPDAFLNPITQATWRLTMLGYFALSVVGAYKAFTEEKWEIPFLSDFAQKIEKQMKDK